MAESVKNYLITGFSGFVSRYFVEYLHQVQEKANILGIDVAKPYFDFEHSANCDIKFSKVDLLDRNKIRDIIAFTKGQEWYKGEV